MTGLAVVLLAGWLLLTVAVYLLLGPLLRELRRLDDEARSMDAYDAACEALRRATGGRG